MWIEQRSRSSLEVTSQKSLSQERYERDPEVHHLESRQNLVGQRQELSQDILVIQNLYVSFTWIRLKKN